jgi:hypothetical protein
MNETKATSSSTSSTGQVQQTPGLARSGVEAGRKVTVESAFTELEGVINKLSPQGNPKTGGVGRVFQEKLGGIRSTVKGGENVKSAKSEIKTIILYAQSFPKGNVELLAKARALLKALNTEGGAPTPAPAKPSPQKGLAREEELKPGPIPRRLQTVGSPTIPIINVPKRIPTQSIGIDESRKLPTVIRRVQSAPPPEQPREAVLSSVSPADAESLRAMVGVPPGILDPSAFGVERGEDGKLHEKGNDADKFLTKANDAIAFINKHPNLKSLQSRKQEIQKMVNELAMTNTEEVTVRSMWRMAYPNLIQPPSRMKRR